MLPWIVTLVIVTVVTVVIVTVVTVTVVTVVIVTYFRKKQLDTSTTDEMFSGQHFAILTMFCCWLAFTTFYVVTLH